MLIVRKSNVATLSVLFGIFTQKTTTFQVMLRALISVVFMRLTN